MKRAFELDFFAKVRYPSHLKVRGEDLYFLAKQGDLAQNSYPSDLYRTRGGETRRLTTTGDVGDYALLEEGIVFPALRKGEDKAAAERGEPLTVFHQLPYDGGEAAEVLRLSYKIQEFHWLSGGGLLFRAELDHRLEGLRAQHPGDLAAALQAKKEEDDACTVIDELPFWSNGAGFVNQKRSALYLYDGKETRLLSDPWAQVEHLVLSKEGNQALCAVCRYQDRQPMENQLHLLTLPEGQLRPVEGLPEGSVADYAFDGDRAVVTLYPKDATYGYAVGNPRVYAVPLGGGQAQLLEDSGLYNYSNTVGSDVKLCTAHTGLLVEGGKMSCLVTLAGDSHLMCFDLHAESLRQVTREPGMVAEVAPYPGGYVMIAMRGDAPPELYTLSSEGEEARLTHLNDALMAGYKVVTPEEFSFTNREGRAIHGWVMRPVGYAPGKRYPTILDIHGGPKTVYGSVLFHEMQYWCGQGYAVLFSNPTGGDGRGEAFADIRGRYGEVDYEDLMGFVDEALDRYDFIDPERLGVTGGSYGGFMTNWIIGHTERFRAAAAQRSISNWMGFTYTSDIGPFFGPDQMQATLWDDAAKMWAHSPLKYADRVTTTTLFIHSEEDYRCNPFEAIQMFSALKELGIDTRLCLFKGENHELSRSGKPKNRIRRLSEITAWMDRYLKG